jgi:hypothetical protein
MSIHDELMALPVSDRLMVCVDVFQATKNMRSAEHRANALEVLFTVMAVTVNELVDKNVVKVERKGAPPRKRHPKSFERKGPPPRSPLTHNPFADVLKKGGDS